MPCRCEDPDYSHIIAGIFDQCMSQTKEIVSFVFGWLSIVSWVVALYPQIRLNFLLRKAEALSPYFLLCWFVGDIFNTTSCFVLDQLFVQKFLGVFWLSTDVILNSSHFYFLLTKKKYTSSATHFRVLEIFIYVVIAGLIINNVVWAGFYYDSELSFNEAAYDICKKEVVIPKNTARYWVGTILAYATIPMFCFSRPTQIYKNWKRKSTEGLSTGLFIATSSGNINQLVSMFVNSQDSKYLIEKTPYIIAAAIPAICDIVVLIQIQIYKGDQQYKKIDESVETL
ncbi:Seven_transmembrane protein 1 [Hexamita inflata]|uniref:Seven transmembrane protein 1 n=1 Tax=Hexamita inflata TaxID=28002 RepID=A0AA86P5C7_9EUKA|nr:Seven transmembrane protein 1 [Hexamita inflata]CAI9930580.1 Seven transmembrane protein 1 [Hexamita inflata]